MRRSAIVFVLLLAVAVPWQARAQQDRRAAVVALLEQRARAVLDGDEAAFAETMAGASAAFRNARLSWFRRMQDLPIGHYRLRPALHSYRDLAAALPRRPAGDEVRVLEVTEEIGFAGYDARPSQESLFLTLVRRGERWHVHDDEGLDGIGFLSARSMWDFAHVRHIERGGVMVLFHTDEANARRILDSTVESIGRIRDRWPLQWRARVVVMIPKSARDLQRILATTIDLGPFVAFAASSVERDRRGAYALTGYRIFVQPDTFFGYSTSFQDDTLGHEMLHYATRPIAGTWTPSWLEEGVAQVFGERRVPPVPELRARAASVDRLPEDHRFFIGSRDRIRLSYQSSAHFADFLRDRYSEQLVARFYHAVGAESPVSFGTDRYHLDRAARATFDVGFDALERAWIERVREEFT